MIGWILKHGDKTSHWYVRDDSICGKMDLLFPGTTKYNEHGNRCSHCKNALCTKTGKKYLDRKSIQDARVDTFEKKYGFTPLHIIKNYLDFHKKSMTLENVEDAVSKWGNGGPDWRVCILQGIISGAIEPGLITKVAGNNVH